MARPLLQSDIPDGKNAVRCKGCGHRVAAVIALTVKTGWTMADDSAGVTRPYCPLCSSSGTPQPGTHVVYREERKCWELRTNDEAKTRVANLAGWFWDSCASVWWTPKPERAVLLAPEFAPRFPPALQRALHAVAEMERAKDESRRASSNLFVPVPPGLAYLPYQVAGIEYASKRQSCLIADEMGLGKTVQALGLVNLTKPSRVLVVCPATLKLNWKREAEKWLVENHKVVTDRVDGSFCVVNYDQLHKHDFAGFELVIFDEAHYLKNPGARRTKLALAIPASRRVFLTGTPVLNRPIELHPILESIDPTSWGNRMRFALRYCDAHQRYVSRKKKVWDVSGSSNLPELQERMRKTCMVRRLKADVLKDLPAKRRQVVVFDAPGVALIEKRLVGSAVELSRAGDLEFGDYAKARHESALAKVPLALDFIKDTLEELGTGKLVVFAHHRDVVAQLQAGLADYGCVVVTGETPMAIRQMNVDEFQTNPGVRVFIGNIKAAGVGLTLTAAANVVFAELDWTPGVMAQAEDRCHRIGQAESVLVRYLVVDGTLDANLAQALESKQSVLDEALDKK